MKLPDQLIFLSNRKKPQKTTHALLTNKTVVITGSTSGVGYQAAKRLAAGEANLIMINRNPDKAESVKIELESTYGIKVKSYIADFKQLKSLRQVMEQLIVENPKVDVLINCAGMHSTKRTWTNEGFETVFCVNHLAPLLITTMLLPTLKQNASRIIQINSEGHRFNGLRLDDLSWKKRWFYSGLLSYGASKIAQLMSVWELNDLLKDTSVTINAMHPGEVRSNIGMNNGLLYRLWNRFFISPLLGDPIKSGEAIYYLAASEEVASVSGKFFNLTHEEVPAKHATDRKISKMVHEKSLEMMNNVW